ncbi:hypothetical protein [Haladaptatus pallidirubidus]|uniref:hypothetical protein n=1 Tax=Haladaptatus pallidirubidus TaxID=1008152 RepID=UPI001D11B26D|nr:hypothetical protein [Haladaptatus pallidirubidus]
MNAVSEGIGWGGRGLRCGGGLIGVENWKHHLETNLEDSLSNFLCVRFSLESATASKTGQTAIPEADFTARQSKNPITAIFAEGIKH